MKHVITILLIAAALTACKNGKENTVSGAESSLVKPNSQWFIGHENDAEFFAGIYPVSQDNPFIIASYDELITQLKWGTGVVVFGFPACPRCRNAFPVLETAFKEANMDQNAGLRGKILYYNIFDDREADNERYKTIVNYVKDYLQNDEEGKPRIYSPDVYFLAAGKITGNHLDTVPDVANPQDLLTIEQETALLKIYRDLLQKITDCGC